MMLDDLNTDLSVEELAVHLEAIAEIDVRVLKEAIQLLKDRGVL